MANNDNSYTKNLDEVLNEEFEYIADRRKSIGLNNGLLKKFGEKIEKLKNSDSGNKWKFDDGKVGLAFSGGGIRSATFNLGVLQALARENILRFCDYLSTVSGGGYIGSCFSSLLDNPDSSEASVNNDGFPFRFKRRKKADERKEVKWLRRHSNYLIPNMKLFSLDLWRFIGLYLSGLVLTNITTVSLTIFLSYLIYVIIHSVQNPLCLATTLLQGSLAVIVLMIITRWGAALRNLGYKARRLRGYLQGFFAITAASLVVLWGFIMLAVHLPELGKEASDFYSNFFSSYFT